MLHAIKQGAIKLAGWYVDVTSKVISLTVQITEDVVATISAISLIDMAAAVSLVHGLFGWLGAPLADVLNWLKDQLPWADIWSTMETFNGYVTDGLTGVTGILEYKATIASGDFFARWKSEIDSSLSQAAQSLGAQPLRPAGSNTLSGMPPITLPGSATTQNWLLSKLWTAAGAAEAGLLPDPGVSLDALYTQISDAVTALEHRDRHGHRTAEPDPVPERVLPRPGQLRAGHGRRTRRKPAGPDRRWAGRRRHPGHGLPRRGGRRAHRDVW